jgi:hypothetical protein
MQTVAQEAFASTLDVILKLGFAVLIVLLPIFLIRGFWKAWVRYVRAEFFAQQKYVLLECRLPKGIAKGPLAMEIVITSLFQPGGEANLYAKYWQGSTRPWFSLEIASLDGYVRFFIWTRAKFKEMIETQLYAQFSDIEIDDVTRNDYAHMTPFDPENHQYWACEYKKTGPSHLPIKTYTAYGLTTGDSGDASKESGKVDPITPVIEFLGSLHKGEQAWLQICVRAHVKDKTKPGTWFEKVDWKHAAEEDLIKRNKRDLKLDPLKPVNPSLYTLTKGEKEAVDAIEGNLGKIPFDCGIRAVYVAKKDAYRSTTQAGLAGILRHFGTPNLNSFKLEAVPGFSYPWQDISGKKTLKQKKRLFELYQWRSFFVEEYIPKGYPFPPFVMTTEELATIYHYPGQVSRTPTLTRLSAKRVEPPANLPI